MAPDLLFTDSQAEQFVRYDGVIYTRCGAAWYGDRGEIYLMRGILRALPMVKLDTRRHQQTGFLVLDELPPGAEVLEAEKGSVIYLNRARVCPMALSRAATQGKHVTLTFDDVLSVDTG